MTFDARSATFVRFARPDRSLGGFTNLLDVYVRHLRGKAARLSNEERIAARVTFEIPLATQKTRARKREPARAVRDVLEGWLLLSPRAAERLP